MKTRNHYVDPRKCVTLGDGATAYEGDYVRIGNGTGHLWRIALFYGEEIHLIDEVTGRKRKTTRGNLMLSFHG
ncbi:MAG TPA: hypothetical protein VLI04_14855 [Nocardioidaceae bacterium]|nr:hypothetical protein [Nocardioidaceae bacterium]